MFRLVAQLENLCLPQPTTTNDKVNNKRNLLAVILLLVMPTAEAQIENIRLVDDSTLVLDRVYAGILGANNFSIDSVYRTGFVGFRVGASAKLRVTKAVSVISFIAEDITSAGNSIGGAGFLVRVQPDTNFYIAIGHGPQVSTFLQRQHPATAGGQFETFTHRAIPGPGLGVRLVKTIKKIDLLAGVAMINGAPEYQLGISHAGLQASVWLQGDSLWGTAITYESDRFKTILVVRDDLLANVTTFNLPNKYILYADAGMTTDDCVVVRAEAGVLRTFKAKSYIKGLFGLGYAYELRSVRGYIFVTL